MMLALMKKDLRVYVVPTIGGIVLISLTYLIAFGALAITVKTLTSRAVTEAAGPAAAIGMCITALLASAYGGASFAAERREHSSDWLNMLPITRRQIITSKVLVSFGCMAGLWIYALTPIVLMSLLAPRFINERIPLHIFFAMFGSTMGACWVLFGLAWLLSTFMESPSISACIAIVFIFLVMLAEEGIRHALRWHGDGLFICGLVLLGIAATTSFAIGTRYYLHRVAP